MEGVRGAKVLFSAAPSLEIEILGVQNASTLPILRNIGGAIAPPAPPVPPPLLN